MAPNNGVLNQPKKKLGTTLIFFAQEFHEVRVIPRTAQGSGYARICAATEQAKNIKVVPSFVFGWFKTPLFGAIII